MEAQRRRGREGGLGQARVPHRSLDPAIHHRSRVRAVLEAPGSRHRIRHDEVDGIGPDRERRQPHITVDHETRTDRQQGRHRDLDDEQGLA